MKQTEIKKAILLVKELKLILIKNQQYENTANLRDIEKSLVKKVDESKKVFKLNFPTLNTYEEFLKALKDDYPNSYMDFLNQYEQ